MVQALVAATLITTNTNCYSSKIGGARPLRVRRAKSPFLGLLAERKHSEEPYTLSSARSRRASTPKREYITTAETDYIGIPVHLTTYPTYTHAARRLTGEEGQKRSRRSLSGWRWRGATTPCVSLYALPPAACMRRCGEAGKSGSTTPPSPLPQPLC